MSLVYNSDPVFYGAQKNFSALKFPNHEIVRGRDFVSVVRNRIGPRKPFFVKHIHYSHSKNRLWHHFNKVSFSKGPWITTFETMMPRWANRYNNNWFEKFGIKYMASDSCKKLIAMSDVAYKLQRNLLEDYPEYSSEIVEKLMVLHPSQALNIDSIKQKKDETTPLKIAFVGGDFSRKGGYELVLAVKRLVEKGADLELNIVSSDLNSIFKNPMQQTLREELKSFVNTNNHINYIKSTSHENVMNLLKSADIGALPTYYDTYGYFALESLASGCALISTNVRALPEINSNDRGWIIDLDLDDEYNAILESKENRDRVSEKITSDIVEILEDALNNRSGLIRKQENAIDYITKNHNPKDAIEILDKLYTEFSV